MRILIALAAMLLAAMPAQAAWRRASSDHFIVYSQLDEKALRRYAERLERFDAALRTVFPARARNERPERLTIYMLASDGAVRKVMGASGTTIAGVYRGSAAGSVALTGQMNEGMSAQLTLLHEYAHHFMLHNFPAAYPAWFVEGFAEFASTARFEDSGSVGLGLPAQHRAYAFSETQALPVPSMVSADYTRLKGAAVDVLYAQGWLLTHYLIFDPARKGQLEAYLHAINEGKTARQAAEAAFGDLRTLGANMRTYLSRATMRYWRLPPTMLEPGKVTIEALSAAENAILPVRIESRYGVGRAEAKALVAPARAAAAPFPADEAAQTMLAEAEYDAGNLDEAEAAADRALKADPASFWGLIYKGRVAVSRTAQRKAAPDDIAWTEARRWFVKANRADLDHPLPMMLFYMAYGRAGGAPTPNAIDGLIGAALRAPQDDNLRVIATVELLRQKRVVDAKKMLGPVANEPHGGGAGWLAGLYARLDSDPPEALADELRRGPPNPDSPAGKAEG